MRSGLGENLQILQFAVMLSFFTTLFVCRIPLPQETDIVVQAFDSRGGTVDGDELVTFPVPIFGGNIFFTGHLMILILWILSGRKGSF